MASPSPPPSALHTHTVTGRGHISNDINVRPIALKSKGRLLREREWKKEKPTTKNNSELSPLSHFLQHCTSSSISTNRTGKCRAVLLLLLLQVLHSFLLSLSLSLSLFWSFSNIKERSQRKWKRMREKPELSSAVAVVVVIIIIIPSAVISLLLLPVLLLSPLIVILAPIIASRQKEKKRKKEKRGDQGGKGMHILRARKLCLYSTSQLARFLHSFIFFFQLASKLAAAAAKKQQCQLISINCPCTVSLQQCFLLTFDLLTLCAAVCWWASFFLNFFSFTHPRLVGFFSAHFRSIISLSFSFSLLSKFSLARHAIKR